MLHHGTVCDAERPSGSGAGRSWMEVSPGWNARLGEGVVLPQNQFPDVVMDARGTARSEGLPFWWALLGKSSMLHIRVSLRLGNVKSYASGLVGLTGETPTTRCE